jgi:hypothetical protein
MTLTFLAGHRYLTRGGATVYVVAIRRDIILYPFLVGRFERLADGRPCTPAPICPCPEGNYWTLGEHENDLVSEIGAMG